MPSSTESETWSQTLSGCPSVTDSDVRRNELDSLKEVATTAANHNFEPSTTVPTPVRSTFLAPNVPYLSGQATVWRKTRGIGGRQFPFRWRLSSGDWPSNWA